MPDSVLTPLQALVLESLFASGLGDRGFFLSGGTALAEFYLRHRYSDDLDVFTRKAALADDDRALVAKTLDDLGLETERKRESSTFVRYSVRKADTAEDLMIDLVADPLAMMAPPIRRGAVLVDSLEDIAVNKICTIFDRREPKDFVDLYFILNESTFQLDHLLARASEKSADLEGAEGVLGFATSLLRANDLERLPRMIKPLSLEQLRLDLVPRAEALIRRLRPQG